MKAIVLGSGGCTPIPRPGCTCPVCEEARHKGIPFARGGPSFFLENINALFDTPEDILHQLNRERIQKVDYIFYTHWHPDHTMGMRVVEQMYMDFLAVCLEGKQPAKKVNVCALPEVLSDIRAIQNKYGSYLEYYERNGLVSLAVLEKEKPFTIDDIEIIPLLVEHPTVFSTVFIIKSRGKKVVYAPCDAKPFPLNDVAENADILIIGDILPDRTMKNGYYFPEGSPFEQEVILMDELVKIIESLNVKRTIGVHIEEEWGKSFDDYKRIEKQYKEFNIEFGFDGMRIEL